MTSLTTTTLILITPYNPEQRALAIQLELSSLQRNYQIVETSIHAAISNLSNRSNPSYQTLMDTLQNRMNVQKLLYLHNMEVMEYITSKVKISNIIHLAQKSNPNHQ